MKKIFSAIVAALSAAVSVYAQNEAFVWMSQYRDPVYSAMAGASAASSYDIVYSAFRNPAAIAFSSERHGAAGAAYSMSLGTAESGIYAGTGLKIGKRIGLAAAGNYNPGSSYEVFDDFGNYGGSFKTSSMMFSAGLGVKVIEMLSVGVNLKYASESIAPDYTPGAFASDVYVMFKWKGLGVSAGAANVGTKVKEESGTAFSLPSSARVAVNYAATFASVHYVEANLDADYYFSGKPSVALGVQYGFDKWVFVRAGYRYSLAVVPSFASVGLGVGFAGVRLNAAYLIATGDVPQKNTISLGLEYGF